jgi:hypothetical protein
MVVRNLDFAHLAAAGTTQDPDSPACQREVLAGDGLSFHQAAQVLPPGRSDKPVNPSTFWRWARKGARSVAGQRVYLEVCRVGCRWVTSKGALERFLRALADATPAVQPACRHLS